MSGLFKEFQQGYAIHFSRINFHNFQYYLNLHYNNRLQLVDIRLGDSVSGEWNWSRGALISYYGTAARDAWDPFKNSPDNNGNVLRQLHYVPLSAGGYVLPQLDDYTY